MITTNMINQRKRQLKRVSTRVDAKRKKVTIRKVVDLLARRELDEALRIAQEEGVLRELPKKVLEAGRQSVIGEVVSSINMTENRAELAVELLKLLGEKDKELIARANDQLERAQHRFGEGAAAC